MLLHQFPNSGSVFSARDVRDQKRIFWCSGTGGPCGWQRLPYLSYRDDQWMPSGPAQTCILWHTDHSGQTTLAVWGHRWTSYRNLVESTSTRGSKRERQRDGCWKNILITLLCTTVEDGCTSSPNNWSLASALTLTLTHSQHPIDTHNPKMLPTLMLLSNVTDLNINDSWCHNSKSKNGTICVNKMLLPLSPSWQTQIMSLRKQVTGMLNKCSFATLYICTIWKSWQKIYF